MYNAHPISWPREMYQRWVNFKLCISNSPKPHTQNTKRIYAHLRNELIAVHPSMYTFNINQFKEPINYWRCYNKDSKQFFATHLSRSPFQKWLFYGCVECSFSDLWIWPKWQHRFEWFFEFFTSINVLLRLFAFVADARAIFWALTSLK